VKQTAKLNFLHQPGDDQKKGGNAKEKLPKGGHKAKERNQGGTRHRGGKCRNWNPRGKSRRKKIKQRKRNNWLEAKAKKSFRMEKGTFLRKVTYRMPGPTSVTEGPKGHQDTWRFATGFGRYRKRRGKKKETKQSVGKKKETGKEGREKEGRNEMMGEHDAPYA